MSSFNFSTSELLLVIDIKSTGVDASDDIIAIGFCAMTYDRETVKKYRCGMKLRTTEEIHRMHNGQLSWYDLWKRRGYNIDCFNRFWRKRVDKLDKLQDENYIKLLNTRVDLAFEINRILVEIERMCQKLTIVTNTVAFDTVQVGRLLANEHLQPLHYSRNGEYRWLYHTIPNISLSAN